jgi:hypothetical protein
VTLLSSYAEQQLRARLEYSLAELKPEASLYLTVLGCLLLACDDENRDAETMLASLFMAQTKAEDLDSNEILQGLCMVKA